MSRFGKTKETESKLSHNERLEFLGDAVIEFITTVHLYYIFTDYQEGALATFRGAIVQNKNLVRLIFHYIFASISSKVSLYLSIDYQFTCLLVAQMALHSKKSHPTITAFADYYKNHRLL
jgi:hypothetical protein